MNSIAKKIKTMLVLSVVSLSFASLGIPGTAFASPGDIDPTFNSGTGIAGSYLLVTHLQSDGKILLGGDFTSYNGTARNRIARINTDGTLDTSFDPGTGANNLIFHNGLALQSDGKIVIGGWFTSFNGTARNGVARINTDGSLDTSFDPGTGGTSVHSLLVQPDGKIVVTGQFDFFNGTPRYKIARLNTDGSLDTGFSALGGTNNTIQAATLLANGKFIVVGDFTTYNSIPRNRIARLNADGSLDTSFDPGTGFPTQVTIVKEQSWDSKIIVGGTFTSYNGTARNRIVRINTDGSLDTSFDPGTGANGNVYGISIQPNYKVVLGGFFSSYDGSSANRVVRIQSVETTAPTLVSVSPLDEATLVPVATDLSITFSEAVESGSGSIIVYKLSDNSLVETISAASGQVTGTGTDTVSVSLSSPLLYESDYYVLIDQGAFVDEFGNEFAGIAAPTDWNFTTDIAPVVPPTPSSGGSTVIGTRFGCKDTAASNYDRFSRHKQSLCEYDSATAVVPAISDIDVSGLVGHVIRLGNRGSHVSVLQTLLNQVGVTPQLVADGIFGNMTLAAVKTFQAQKGLVSDGIVGPKTITALSVK